MRGLPNLSLLIVIHLFISLVIFVILVPIVEGGVNRFNMNQGEELSESDEERLSKLYGHEMVASHRRDFLSVGQKEMKEVSIKNIVQLRLNWLHTV